VPSKTITLLTVSTKNGGTGRLHLITGDFFRKNRGEMEKKRIRMEVTSTRHKACARKKHSAKTLACKSGA